MKLTIGLNSLEIQFSRGGGGSIELPEIMSIDLQTVPTMTVDVDIVCLNYENGDFVEISDDALGFEAACDHLSTRLRIVPSIREQFPVPEGNYTRVYEAKK